MLRMVKEIRPHDCDTRMLMQQPGQDLLPFPGIGHMLPDSGLPALLEEGFQLWRYEAEGFGPNGILMLFDGHDGSVLNMPEDESYVSCQGTALELLEPVVLAACKSGKLEQIRQNLQDEAIRMISA